MSRNRHNPNPVVTGTLDDPAYLSARGKAGAAAIHSTEAMIGRLGARDLTHGQRARLVEVAAPSADDLIAVLAARAPQLNETTSAKLRAILANSDGA